MPFASHKISSSFSGSDITAKYNGVYGNRSRQNFTTGSSYFYSSAGRINTNASHLNYLTTRVAHSKFVKMEYCGDKARRKGIVVTSSPIQKFLNRTTSTRKLLLDRPLSVYRSLIKLENTNHSRRTSHIGNSTSSIFSNNLSIDLLLILFFLTALGITALAETQEALAEESADGQLPKAEGAADAQFAKIKALLAKDPMKRSIDERMELFSYLLAEVEKKVTAAKDKNVVIVFGETGAGKSTLINFLYGCKMIKDAEDNIVVDENSIKKEVAKIAPGSTSCTILSEKIDTVYKNSEDKEHDLTFYDMAGLNETRGVEVVLANAIAMKKLVENVGLLKFVMVFEQGLLYPSRYKYWIVAVESLHKRFNTTNNTTIGSGKKDLCLVVTKNTDDIKKIKKDIKTVFDERDSTGKRVTPIDLSNYATVYNPLDEKDREKLLSIILDTKDHKKFQTQILMGATDIVEARALGNQVNDEVEKDLKSHKDEVEKKSKDRIIDNAVKKIKFTYEMSQYDKTAFSQCHDLAATSVQNYVKAIVKNIEPEKSKLENQIEKYKEYINLKDKFEPYVNFNEYNKNVQESIERSKDDRWVALDKPTATGVSAVATVAFTAAVIAFPPAAVIAAGGGIATCIFGYYYKNPPQKEKDKSKFFEGLK